MTYYPYAMGGYTVSGLAYRAMNLKMVVFTDGFKNGILPE